MLTYQDWYGINNIVLTLYGMEDDASMRKYFLKALKVLVPFEKGVFFLAEGKDDSLSVHDPVSIGADSLFLSRYCQYGTSTDYAAPLLNMNYSVTYRDTDLLEDTARRQTVFYQDFLKQYQLPFAGGMTIVKDGRFLGEVTLYRNETLGDFVDREMEIMEILMHHLENRLFFTSLYHGRSQEDIDYKKYKKLGLTMREIEIAEMAGKGLDNEEICRQLNISVFTVKKHFSNIFKKLEVTNRIELMQYVMK